MIKVPIYQYVGAAVCVLQRPLIDSGIISICKRKDGTETVPLWNKWRSKAKGNFVVIPGGNGRESALEISAIPEPYRKKVIDAFGNPDQAAHPLEKFFVLDADARVFYETFTFEDGTHLTKDQITRYTLNASVLNAVSDFHKDRENMRRRSGHSARGVWQSVVADVVSFSDHLKTKYGTGHSIKETRFSQKLRQYAQEGYIMLVDGRNRNKAAAKIETDHERMALLEELLKKHSNFNDEQVRGLYNMAATRIGWPSISAGTVANHRQKLGLYIDSGRHGITQFRTTRTMQVKRHAPTVAMAYWSIDGWDAELLFQKETTRTVKGKPQKVTTYHNRLTVVVIIDPVGGLKYPIGYAIGSHETPELIREALRNAVNHTRELFGQRYKTLQLQSDHYGNGALTPIYEAVSHIYTPAAVKNAKAKPVERYFHSLNKMAQLNYPNNWSGHNMDASRKNQPNEDFLNMIRHGFPDENGCREQIERLMAMDRLAKEEKYLEYWEALPEADRKPLTTAEYLYLFGETHTHTNRIQGNGLTPTLMGREFAFDTFDTRFRELGYLDWAVKYDPTDMGTVLVLDAKADHNRRLVEVVGNHRFELTAKHDQPMDLYSRKDGDAGELQKVFDFNKRLEASIVDRNRKNSEVLTGMFVRNPELDETLTKMVLCDSNGQHKDTRNLPRSKNNKPTPQKALPQSEESYEIVDDDVRSMYGTGI